MYIGRAMSQKSPLGATHPATSATLESITVQSLDLILDLLRPLGSFQPSLVLLGFDGRNPRLSAAKPDCCQRGDGNDDADGPIHHFDCAFSRPIRPPRATADTT